MSLLNQTRTNFPFFQLPSHIFQAFYGSNHCSFWLHGQNFPETKPSNFMKLSLKFIKFTRKYIFTLAMILPRLLQ